MYQILIPSFSGFSSVPDRACVEEADKKVQSEQPEQRYDGPLMVLNVLLVDSVLDCPISSQKDSDAICLTFDSIKLWWAKEMKDPPGMFLKTGTLHFAYESETVGTFEWFHDAISDEDEDGPGLEYASGKNVFNGEVSFFAESSGAIEFV